MGKPAQKRNRYRKAKATVSASPVSLTVYPREAGKLSSRVVERSGAAIVQSGHNASATDEKLIARPEDTLPQRVVSDGRVLGFRISAAETRNIHEDESNPLRLVQRIDGISWFFKPGLTQDEFLSYLALPQFHGYHVYNGNRTPVFGAGDGEVKPRTRKNGYDRWEGFLRNRGDFQDDKTGEIVRPFLEASRMAENELREARQVESALARFDRAEIDPDPPAPIYPVDDMKMPWSASRQLRRNEIQDLDGTRELPIYPWEAWYFGDCGAGI